MAIINHKLGQTFYVTKGRHKQPPLIVLHGGPGSGHAGKLDMFELATDRKVIMYDQLGCGKSSPLKQGQCTIATFVEELSTLKRKLGVAQFHLFGASWGTTLAVEYYLATKDPDCLSITFQSPLFSAKDWKRDAENLIAKLPNKIQKVIRYCHEIGATDAQVYKVAMCEYYSRYVCRNKQALSAMMSRIDSNGKTIYHHMWGPSEFEPTGTLKSYTCVKKLNQVNVPSLIVCGRYDEARPETAQTYVDRMPNAQLKIIAKASHVILKENKPALLRAIQAHILANDQV